MGSFQVKTVNGSNNSNISYCSVLQIHPSNLVSKMLCSKFSWSIIIYSLSLSFRYLLWANGKQLSHYLYYVLFCTHTCRGWNAVRSTLSGRFLFSGIFPNFYFGLPEQNSYVNRSWVISCPIFNQVKWKLTHETRIKEQKGNVKQWI